MTYGLRTTQIKIRSTHDSDLSAKFYLSESLESDCDIFYKWLKRNYPKNDYNIPKASFFIKAAVLHLYILFYKAKIRDFKRTCTEKRLNNDQSRILFNMEGRLLEIQNEFSSIKLELIDDYESQILISGRGTSETTNLFWKCCSKYDISFF